MLTVQAKGVKMFKCVRVSQIFIGGNNFMIDLGKQKKVVGSQETLQAIKSKKTHCVYIAKDTDENLKNEIINEAKNSNINIKEIESKMQLGRVCGIEVAAASAALLK